mgnify:CR=1 FL=1
MRKWLAFLIVGILLLSILQGGHGGIDFLLMFVLFLIDNRAGHFVLVLIVLVPLGSMIWGGHVRSRRDSEQAMKQMVDVVRQRTAAMEARIALLEGRAPDVKTGGGEGDDQAVHAAEGGAAKGVVVASGSGAAGTESSPGKAGPDQARGNEGAAPGDVGGRVKPEDVVGDGGRGWRVLFVDLAKMVVFVSFLALLWAGSAHLFACGEPKLGRLEVSFQKCETRR